MLGQPKDSQVKASTRAFKPSLRAAHACLRFAPARCSEGKGTGIGHTRPKGPRTGRGKSRMHGVPKRRKNRILMIPDMRRIRAKVRLEEKSRPQTLAKNQAPRQ